ncbi:MAG: flagellar hook-basal body complex protein [Selenomonadaceae bacterium]|nr:flagellar hook-basal body complex protein [Selenomonadaceae bacterium]
MDKDSSSVMNDPNAEAEGTRTGTNYTYTDSTSTPPKTYKATEYTGNVYSDGTDYYPASEVTVTKGTLKSDSGVTVDYDETSRKYKDSTGKEYSLSEIEPTEWALTSDLTKTVTKSEDPVVTYTDDEGKAHYVAADNENVTATPAYDNRWRAYIAPGKGVKGPADSAFENTFTYTESDGSTVTGTMNSTYPDGDKVSYLYFDELGTFVTEGRETGAIITFDYANGNGAASNQPVTLDFTKMVQYASATTSFPTSDGNTAGILQSIAIDGNGIITGSYTNGLVRNEAQIAVAQFTNAAGLTKVGTTIYQESNNSGEANVRTVETFGLTVTSSALEMSNVDLASEFADMIVTQRGFQANSKMTVVADEMLETVVNMKR